MTIHPTPEQEQVIGRAVQAGLVSGADDVLDLGVEAIRRRLEQRGTSAKPVSVEQWSREFHAWVQSHSMETPLLSEEAISRDSIYGIRGM